MDKQFINPIVITVKKDQTVKLALDFKQNSKLIHRIEYQMPNIELLLDKIAKIIWTDKHQEKRFSTLDLRYAHSQITLDIETRNQCNFSFIRGKTTGTDQFPTDFYGLKDMLAEIQKAINLKLTNYENPFDYHDDILIVTKVSKYMHKQSLQKGLRN